MVGKSSGPYGVESLSWEVMEEDRRSPIVSELNRLDIYLGRSQVSTHVTP